MASLDADEEPPPCSTAYNKRLTKEEHETVVSAETEKQLNSLLLHLEKNPKMFSEFLKKRKVSEMERAGLFSNLKVKVLSAIYGKDFMDDIDLETCKNKLEEFETTTVNTYNNSQESKGRTHKFSHSQIRYSKRIAERQGRCSSIPPPPPPPPPPPLSMVIQGCNGKPKALQERKQLSNFKKDHVNRKRTASTNTLQEEIKSMSKRIVKRKPLGQVSTNSARTKIKRVEESCSFQTELMLAKKKLRSVGLPDQTPYQVSKLRRGQEEQDENQFPLFNQELIQKFRNTRSPQSPASYSNCSSPGGYEATP